MIHEDHLADLTTRIARQYNRDLETTLLTAIHHTDWTQTAVLDIIIAHPTPQLTTWTVNDHDSLDIHGLDTKIKVRRHAERAPPLPDVSIPNRRCDIYRLTEPLLRELRPALEAHGYSTEALL